MEQWYREKYSDGVELNLQIKQVLVSQKTKVQQVDIFDSVEFGRVLCLDGQLMHTEKDEKIYHEMMVHPALAANPNIKDVLVISVGNGGIVHELIKYKSIESITVVEDDLDLIALLKKFMPKSANALNDNRVNMVIADNMRFTRTQKGKYDLIILDIPDPFGQGENHFTKEFYGACFTALKEDGILINQHESCFYEDDIPACQKAHFNSKKVFNISKVFQASIPSYPSGYWLFGFSSKKHDPYENLDKEAWEKLKLDTVYYNPYLHIGAFMLPTYVQKVLNKAK
ncbi:MAG: polyamine aminopropyltransferase [Firmicutes bacterium]|nr:polyamine aminopropyltransferase [Bacillota bacterium]